jgi:hypothetical protein
MAADIFLLQFSRPAAVRVERVLGAVQEGVVTGAVQGLQFPQ